MSSRIHLDKPASFVLGFAAAAIMVMAMQNVIDGTIRESHAKYDSAAMDAAGRVGAINQAVQLGQPGAKADLASLEADLSTLSVTGRYNDQVSAIRTFSETYGATQTPPKDVLAKQADAALTAMKIGRQIHQAN